MSSVAQRDYFTTIKPWRSIRFSWTNVPAFSLQIISPACFFKTRLFMDIWGVRKICALVKRSARIKGGIYDSWVRQK